MWLSNREAQHRHPRSRPGARVQSSRPFPAASGASARPTGRGAAPGHPPEESARRERGAGCLSESTGRLHRRPPRLPSSLGGASPRRRSAATHIAASTTLFRTGADCSPVLLLLLVPSSSRDGQGRPPRRVLQPLERRWEGSGHLSAPQHPGAAGGTAGYRTPSLAPRCPGRIPLAGGRRQLQGAAGRLREAERSSGEGQSHGAGCGRGGATLPSPSRPFCALVVSGRPGSHRAPVLSHWQSR